MKSKVDARPASIIPAAVSRPIDQEAAIS